MSDLHDQHCINCVYWYGSDITAAGMCRAHPPIPDGNGQMGRWPATFPDDWCGEWHE